MKYIFFLCLIFIGLFVFCHIYSKKICLDCNVILISIDTLRADHVGVYGYEYNTTPNIDSFSNESTVYSNSYSTSSWTLPAHASMFASDMPVNLKMQSIFDKLPNSVVTLSDVLRSNGYFSQGFDSLTYVSPRWNFSKGFNSFVLEATDSSVNDASLIFSHASDWIARNKNKKFYLFLHTFQVHDPYCPPKDYQEKFRGSYKGSSNCIRRDEIAKNSNSKNSIPEEELRRYISLYDGEIAYTDEMIGRFLSELKKLDLDKKTIVIITSDHGEEFGEHGTWGNHGKTLYNEVLKVPLIIKAPNLKIGKVNTPASTMDIAPTILDLLGIAKPEQFKGISLIMKNPRSPLFFELANTGLTVKQSIDKEYGTIFDTFPRERGQEMVEMNMTGVLVGNWKLIKNYSTGELELFDIASDKLEKNNFSSKFPEVVSKLEKLLTIESEQELPIKTRSSSDNKNYINNTTDSYKSLGY